jgi:hypothetical protein
METPSKKPRLSLKKSQLQSAIATELLNLCQTITEDGRLSQEEVLVLKTWLEKNQDADLPAIDFLTTTVRKIVEDSRVTKEELRLLYKAVEVVLPPEVRKEAVGKRREVEAKEKILTALERDAQKEKERQEREVNYSLLSANFMVAGVRHEGRPEVIKHYAKRDEQVFLVRDRQNKYSRNAIEVRLKNGMQIGFVPEDDAVELAPFLDKGCKHHSYITKILTRGRSPIPVVQAEVYSPEATIMGVVKESQVPEKHLYSKGSGKGCLLTGLLILAAVLLGVGVLLFLMQCSR